MKKDTTIAILGGDTRFAYLASLLAERYKVYGLFMEKDTQAEHCIKSCDIKDILPECSMVILPLPVLDIKGFINAPNSACRVSLEECLDCVSPNALVLGGMVTGESMSLARRRDIAIVDYLEREEFAVLNAVPTAEGAVQIALQELPVTLFGSVCLITGFGRIAKVLARLLTAFGATVKVVARKCGDLAWARVNGCEAVHISRLSEVLADVDIVFNTVPAVLMDESKLSALKEGCLLIDLASKPGGVDYEAAKHLGLKAIWALSLPGKVAPMTAAEFIRDTIYNILSERGNMGWER